MKHAGKEALDQLEPVLAELRLIGGMKEKKRGIFYRKSAAFLHFHEDTKGLFADVKLDGFTFSRFRVSTKQEQRKLVRRVSDFQMTTKTGVKL